MTSWVTLGACVRNPRERVIASQHDAGHLDAGNGRNSDEVRCNTGTDCVGTSIIIVCCIKMRRIHIYVPLCEAMIQGIWLRKFGQRQELCCCSEIFKKPSGQRYSEDYVRQKKCCSLRQRCTFYFAASVHRAIEVGHEVMARTCSDLASRHNVGYRNGCCGKLKYALSGTAAAAAVVGKNSHLGGEQREYFDLEEGEPIPEGEKQGKPDATPHVSEFKQQCVLQWPVTLTEYLKRIQLVKKRNQLVSPPTAPLV